jgi:predicted Zn finger-like uncharacterized protein
MTSASASMITRCPQCGTAFRITEAQLSLAKGKVRCGSCLTIFKAQENLTDVLDSEEVQTQTKAPVPKPVEKPSAPQSKPKAPVTTAKEAKTTSRTQPTAVTKTKPKSDDHDEMMISDNMDDATQSGAGFDNFMQVNLGPTGGASLFDRKIKMPDENELIKDTDESWAEMLMEDDDHVPEKPASAKEDRTQIKQKEGKQKQTKHRRDHDDDSSDTRPPRKTPLGTPAVTPTPGLVFNLVEEKQGNELEYEPDVSDSDAFKQAAASFNAEMFENPEESEPTSKRQAKTHPKIRAYDSERSALLMNIIPAPIEFTVKNIRRYQDRLWPAVSALGLVILIIQLAWFKFDYFSRVEPYRTAYVFLCPILGCKVPSLVDTKKIGLSNLVVRQGVEGNPDARVVDVMMLNKAPFDQPFPDLVLAFTDINQNHVASRRFTPKEYLSGELRGRTLIPHNQPVHITLELVDPGSQAENYHIYIPR